jgi:CO/xanthine dehydrogenase Mo-binding subunit
MKDISKSIKKVDSDDKSTGKSLYVNDINIPDILHAKTIRAPFAKAKIINRKYPELPEGYYIIDHSDIPGKNFIKIIFEDWPVFAVDEINHYLEPIALIIGPDKEVVQDLAGQFEIEYEELTPEFDYVDSAIHYHFNKGDIEQVKKECDSVIEIDYETPYQEQLYIEPQGMIGYFDDGQVTLVGSIQCPYYVKNAVISILDSKEDYIRVKQSTVGGAFGGKEEFPSLLACHLAVAVDKIKKPISLIYEREEDMEVTTKRHPSKIKLTGYIKDQKLVGIKSNVGIDAGAYIGLSGVVLSRALIASTGAYTINHLEVDGDVFITNTVPNGAFRGFGAPQMLFAVEMFVHHVAKELGVDPLEFRKDILAKQNDRTSTSGTYRDPIIMPEMLEKALKESDYERKIVEYSKNDSYKGIGMSWFLHGCGFTGSGEATHIKALVELEKTIENKVVILIAAVDMGQGVKTTMKKIVANILDIPVEDVIYENPDTNKVPDSGPTVASRTIMIVGGLVARAARQLKEQWIDNQYQKVFERYSQPEYIKWNEETFYGDAYPAYSWGINIVEVEVNPLTYEVSVKEEWSVYDVGKAIDEQIILGQVDGGQLQGLGYGYLEKMTHKDGKIQHKNVTDYIIPTTVDTPLMHTFLMDNPYPLGPYGAKGAGELTLVGGAPAVALAIENAIGKRVTKIPVTPEYIMELIDHE